MYLIKSKNGTYSPCDDTDFELSKKVGIGTVVKATAPRNYKFLKKAMALLNIGHSNQDVYESFEVYRKIKTIQAGFFEEAPDKDGAVIYLPKSLAFDNMSAKDFDSWYVATLDVIAKDMDTAPETIKQEIESFY